MGKIILNTDNSCPVCGRSTELSESCIICAGCGHNNSPEIKERIHEISTKVASSMEAYNRNLLYSMPAVFEGLQQDMISALTRPVFAPSISEFAQSLVKDTVVVDIRNMLRPAIDSINKASFLYMREVQESLLKDIGRAAVSVSIDVHRAMYASIMAYLDKTTIDIEGAMDSLDRAKEQSNVVIQFTWIYDLLKTVLSPKNIQRDVTMYVSHRYNRDVGVVDELGFSRTRKEGKSYKEDELTFHRNLIGHPELFGKAKYKIDDATTEELLVKLEALLRYVLDDTAVVYGAWARSLKK